MSGFRLKGGRVLGLSVAHSVARPLGPGTPTQNASALTSSAIT